MSEATVKGGPICNYGTKREMCSDLFSIKKLFRKMRNGMIAAETNVHKEANLGRLTVKFDK